MQSQLINMNKAFDDGLNTRLGISASQEAKICLECPLPASKCKPGICKRYNEEIKKLRRSETV